MLRQTPHPCTVRLDQPNDAFTRRIVQRFPCVAVHNMARYRNLSHLVTHAIDSVPIINFASHIKPPYGIAILACRMFSRITAHPLDITFQQPSQFTALPMMFSPISTLTRLYMRLALFNLGLQPCRDSRRIFRSGLSNVNVNLRHSTRKTHRRAQVIRTATTLRRATQIRRLRAEPLHNKRCRYWCNARNSSNARRY